MYFFNKVWSAYLHVVLDDVTVRRPIGQLILFPWLLDVFILDYHISSLPAFASMLIGYIYGVVFTSIRQESVHNMLIGYIDGVVLLHSPRKCSQYFYCTANKL
jgi:hypothetical protein